jgi:hypothetical protein
MPWFRGSGRRLRSDNVRGAEYFQFGKETTMLQERMMDKLMAMRPQGMTDALKAQEQDRSIRELSSMERLGLLVDHQWNWRQN